MNPAPKFLTVDQVLEINGLIVVADEDEFEKLVLDAAQSLATKEQIAEFFKKNTSEVKD